MSLAGTIAAAVVLIATDGTGIQLAGAAYAVAPGVGGEQLSVGSRWIDDDDS